MATNYDLIIVGGGIAGLRVGIEVLKRKPLLRCCILEKYGYMGGRVTTFIKDIPKVGLVAWENGAGRISKNHKNVLKLFKKYNLTFAPISPEVDFIKEGSHPHIIENDFTDLIDYYLGPLERLSPDTLSTHTLKELLDKTIGSTEAKKFYEKFPYYSEIHTLRADLALATFDEEMGTNQGYGVCKEGLTALITFMIKEYLELNGKILMDNELIRVRTNTDKSIILDCEIRSTTRQVSYATKSVVLALHHAALKKIGGGISEIPVLKHLQMMPLLRIYAVFPTKNNVSWFTGINKIVTDSHIRYIIPIDPASGVVMISYTDGVDAGYWMKQMITAGKHGEENVKELVMNDIRALFPDRTIPNPIFFKMHPWFDGCTYWKPGRYNVEDESRKSLRPLAEKYPNLFMCGESFAVNQCWMESALTQADLLLDLDAFKAVINN